MMPGDYQLECASVEQVLSFFERARSRYSGPIPALLQIENRRLDAAFAATLHGEIVGVATLVFHDIDKPEPSTLDTVFILPEHRGRGLGRTLADIAIRWCIRTGRSPVSCHTITIGMARILERLPKQSRRESRVRISYSESFFDP